MDRFAGELWQLELQFSSVGGERGLRPSVEQLSGERDFKYAMIDGTIVRVHQKVTG